MKALLKTGLVVALLGVVACTGGGDDDDDTIPGTPDAGVNLTPDADTTPVCSVIPTYGDIGTIPDTINAERKVEGENESVTLGVGVNADQDGFVLELYKGFTVFQAGIVPGTYQLTGEELNYASCGVCVRFFGDAAPGAPGQDFMATGGTVTITEVGATGSGRLKATLSNLTFTHVTIDGTTFNSTPVGDGCDTAMTGAVIDSPIVAAAPKPGAPTASTRISRESATGPSPHR
jgi:hypothetical protein